MSRKIRVAAAQMGPIGRSEARTSVVARQLDLMREAKAAGAALIVFPELALTTFFPRWLIEDEAEVEAYYESEMPGPGTQPLFDEARRLGIAFHLGYAELDVSSGRKRRFNTAILVDHNGSVVLKYRKIHLPGHAEPQDDMVGQHLEKHYFEVGDLGFPVTRFLNGNFGMAICNDRRWPETYRVMGLQDVEMVLIGYNTPVGLGDPYELDALAPFHNHLSMQAGAYQNSTWVVGVAKAGLEEGYNMIGQSCIIAPSGEIVGMCSSLEDELLVHDCDLDARLAYKKDNFNFARHRRPEHYGLIVERTGEVPPEA